jgi:hypothetical protein
MTMDGYTVKAAAAACGVSEQAFEHWLENGCPALKGQKPKALWKSITVQSHLPQARGASFTRRVRRVPAHEVERIVAARQPQPIPEGRISTVDALERFPLCVTDRKLMYWTDRLRENKTRKPNRANGYHPRGRSPLGKPLTIERYRVLKDGRFFLEKFYLVKELEQINQLLNAEVGRIVENGVEYKTELRLADEYGGRSRGEVSSLFAKWFETAEQPASITRKVLTKDARRGIVLRKQRLWPVAAYVEALRRLDVAKRLGYGGFGPVAKYRAKVTKQNGRATATINPAVPRDNSTVFCAPEVPPKFQRFAERVGESNKPDKTAIAAELFGSRAESARRQFNRYVKKGKIRFPTN